MSGPLVSLPCGSILTTRSIGMLSRRVRVSSAVRIGVLPVLTTCFGPRTAWAGLTGMTWPVTSQSKSGKDSHVGVG
jgi:hypothetical protein